MVVPGALERRELRCVEISEIDAAHSALSAAPVEITSIGLRADVARDFTLNV